MISKMIDDIEYIEFLQVTPKTQMTIIFLYKAEVRMQIQKTTNIPSVLLQIYRDDWAVANLFR